MPWAFAAVSLAGLAFVVNAFFPVRREPMAVPSFFAGWLTGELPLHHIVWQAAATGIFIAFGALASWPGYVGLALTVAGWSGLLVLAKSGRDSRHVIRAALDSAGSPEDPARVSPGHSPGDSLGVSPGHSHGEGSGGHGEDAKRSEGGGTKPNGWSTMWRGARLVHPVPILVRAVEVTRHVDYAGTGLRANTLDVYRRRDAPPTGGPVLLYLHGGAWVIGDKREQGLPMLHELALRGFVCVSANYRLSPRATWPDHIVDVKRAIAWVRSEIAAFGGDPGFLAISGGSAGGHLAALAALSANDPLFQPGFEGTDTSVDACVPLYGVYDMTGGGDSTRYGKGLVSLLEHRVFKKRLAESAGEFRAASPVHRVHPGAPPFFVLHGSNDTLVPPSEARRFVGALRSAAESRVAFAELPRTQHAFDILASPRCANAVAGIANFLAEVHAQHVEQAPWRPPTQRVASPPESPGSTGEDT